jgi:hypothetical protein
VQLVFVYGQVASGKLTIGRELAKLTGLPLFHNHLVVDAVGAVFGFGTEPFVRLREQLWLEIIGEAARSGQSLIFTFAPEPTVDVAFAARVRALVESFGGAVLFVALTVPSDEQTRRLVEPSRAEFGKLRSPDLFLTLAADFARCMTEMPLADLTIATGSISPQLAATQIATRVAR